MAYHHLSRSERGKIALMMRQRVPIREIARRLCRTASTISREVKRNRNDGSYTANSAQTSYIMRRSRCHRKRLYEDERICAYVSEKLLLTWSPEQISGRMKIDYLKEKAVRVSYGSVYRWLKVGLLPRAVQLRTCLRYYRKRKKPKPTTRRPNARNIRTRCREVLRRSRFGDWEVDTIVFGSFPGVRYLLNISERKSKYCALLLLKSIKREEVMRTLAIFFGDGKLPLRTMTSDRGMEFNCYNEFERQFSALYYYADAGKPWQKPIVENTNALIRQFLPRGTKIEEIPSDYIKNIMHLLNNRPRKTLG